MRPEVTNHVQIYKMLIMEPGHKTRQAESRIHVPNHMMLLNTSCTDRLENMFSYFTFKAFPLQIVAKMIETII